MTDAVPRRRRPGVDAVVAVVVGTCAVVAAEVWVSPTPSWLIALDLIAGLALAAAGASLVAVRAAAAGWLLTAGALTWAATTIGLPAAALNTALLVSAVMTDDLRRTRRARPAAWAATAAAWLCVLPAANERGWPWLVVAAGMAGASRTAVGWLAVVPTIVLLTLRALVGVSGSLTEDQRSAVVVAYGLTVVLAAAGCAAAGRLGRLRRDQVIQQVVAVSGGAEVDRLREVLVHAVGDPDLVVSAGGGRLTITSTVLDRDPDLATAVNEAARLAAENQRLRDDLDRQLEAIRASSARLLLAADGQAEALAERLRLGPRRRLARVSSLLDQVRDDESVERAGERLARARAHLARADAGMGALARGTTPAIRTGPELARAIDELARGLHDDVGITITGRAFSPVVGATAYFVCAEALTNVAKHAAADHVAVDVRDEGSSVSVTVSDDGVGGADAGGSGLRGMVARVEALGGHVAIESPSGSGTRVRAVVPT